MMKTLLSALLVFLGIHLFADEGLHAKGRQVPVILNGGEHLLFGKSRDGKIQIEDGTIFKSLPQDAGTVFEEWDYNEHVTFSPTFYPGSGAEYCVLNIDRSEAVYVNLHSKPNPRNEYTLRIRHIDPYDGEIVLWRNDDEGTKQHWVVESKDKGELLDWEQNDRVVIGMNSGWFASFFSSCKFVLVNCDKYGKRSYVRICPQ